MTDPINVDQDLPKLVGQFTGKHIDDMTSEERQAEIAYLEAEIARIKLDKMMCSCRDCTPRSVH